MRKVLSVILVFVLAIGLVACGNTPAVPGQTTPPSTKSGATSSGGDTFKLGAYLPLTGNVAVGGENSKNALELGVKYVNDNGGLNGKKIDLKLYDTQMNAEESVKIATKLIEVDKVDAVIGSFQSGEVLAAGEYYNKAGLLMYGLGTSNSWTIPNWPFVFRVAANNNDTTPMVVKMMQDIAAKKIAVFNSTDDSGLLTADSLIAEAKKAGLEVVTRQQTDPMETDYSAQVANIVASKADVVYMSCSGNINGQFVRQARQGGWDGMIFSKEPLATFMVETAGAENSNHVAFAYPYVTYNNISECKIPVMVDFLKKYQAAYNKLPTAESCYRAWDAVMVLWEASKIAGSNNTEALRAATNKVQIEGLGGKIDFTTGNRQSYSKGFNSFILVDGINIVWNEWIASGGPKTLK